MSGRRVQESRGSDSGGWIRVVDLGTWGIMLLI